MLPAAAFAIALATGACGGGTTPVGPTSLSPIAQLQVDPAAASSGVTASARPTIQAGGQGTWMEGPYAPPNQRTFSFNAQARPEGQTGHAEVFNRGQGVRFQIQFDCVRYDSNTRMLLLGGAVTNSDSADPQVGDKVVTAVRDNGQGAGAAQDEITSVVPAELLPFSCKDFPLSLVAAIVQPALAPITHGNIHVNLSE